MHCGIWVISLYQNIDLIHIPTRHWPHPKPPANKICLVNIMHIIFGQYHARALGDGAVSRKIMNSWAKSDKIIQCYNSYDIEHFHLFQFFCTGHKSRMYINSSWKEDHFSGEFEICCIYFTVAPMAFLLKWGNINSGMDTWLNYLSIPKFQRFHRWSLGMDK